MVNGSRYTSQEGGRVALPRVPELDGLRGIAILSILLLHWHFIAMGNALGSLGRTLDLGWAGVELFFVLSGYLITRILLATRKSPSYFKSFYGRRGLRIFPLYFVTLVLFFHVQLPLMHRAGSWLEITGDLEIWHWLDVQNWAPIVAHTAMGPISHFWSLAVEEQFYFAWPIIVWFVPGKRLPKLCAWMIGACIATGLLFEILRFPQVWHDRATIPRAMSILAGAWVASTRELGIATFSRSTARCLFVTAGLSVNAVSLLRAPYFRSAFTLVDCLVAVTWTALVYLCVTNTESNTLECRIARSPLLKNFGKYSYAIYVLHYVFVWPYIPRLIAEQAYRLPSSWSVTLRADLVYFAMLVALLVGSYGLAVISWYLLEQPFLSLRRLFPYDEASNERRKSASATVATVAVEG